MSQILLDDIVVLGVVTLAGGYQLARFAMRVGKSRMKHKIMPPVMEGPPDFVRTLRAQANCLEFFPLFLVTLWVSGLFLHQVPSAVVGLVYLYSREMYFNGYIKEAEGRMTGFRLGVRMVKTLLFLSAVGLINQLLKTYAGIHVYKLYIKPQIPF